MVLQISEELADVIQQEAKERQETVENFLRSTLQRERTLSNRQKIEREQKWWESLPLTKRAEFSGKYIAIHNRQLVDHDKNETELYARIRKKFGKTPVLIMPAEGPQDIQIYSPRVIQE